jgi:hypothetical protein
MALMQHLNRLNESNLLSKQQKLWFQTPKRSEEFYDLENDPFELNNLIDIEIYSDDIQNLRTQLENWMYEIKDLGHLSEIELVEYVTK